MQLTKIVRLDKNKSKFHTSYKSHILNIKTCKHKRKYKERDIPFSNNQKKKKKKKEGAIRTVIIIK